MNPLPKTGRYGLPSIVLHWLMLVLLLAVYLCMELSDNFPRGSDTRAALRSWHYMLGLSVFLLVWLRLALRFFSVRPAIEPAPSRLQEQLAMGLQAGFYLFMACMPLLGWLILSAKGQPMVFLGQQLPALMAENKAAASWIKEIHEAGATAGYILVAAHAGAALFHHYFLRDNTLRRMLPGKD